MIEKNKNTKKNWLIIGVFFVGEMFIPFSPDKVSFTALIISTIMLILFIITFVLLINSMTHDGKLLTNKSFSKSQIILMYIISIYFGLLFIPNGNIASLMTLSKSSLKIILTVLAIAIGAGFFEEYLVRGFLFNKVQFLLERFNVKKNNLVIISLLTSIFFGLVHLINISSNPTTAVYQQVFYTMCLGLFFSAIRIASNSVLIVAIMHSFFDLQVTVYQPQQETNWFELILAFLPLAVISVTLILLIDKSIQRGKINILR
ncbi:CPBP family intramembrane glutamic endopeptidase [Leuconostoc suionicum]|uniref:CPBP family intramembrane glutamic endopeptidase n=1 Tax=Leuconostoc suionicum TaxID=1511761 RepID=UPI00403635D1